MKFFINFFAVLTICLILAHPAMAQNNVITVVNPVRGLDAWEEKFQPEVTLKGEIETLKKNNISATWLLRTDVLGNKNLLDVINQIPPSHDKGLLLEITPSLANQAGVTYHKSQSWHFAGSVFLTGYSQNDRIKLIDSAFESFKAVFNTYPVSVGAWWIDSFSLNYMQTKYHITGALIVADQYSTDNYQIWGQYWSTPYIPSKLNALFPAQNETQKIPVVMMQWASRDPVNGYGKGVEESTLSVQANDYIDYHKLDINYFSKLIDIYTKQELNESNQVVIGLENSYSWDKYQDEYQKQIGTVLTKRQQGQLNILNMKEFSSWYLNNFKGVSPEQIIAADNPLGAGKSIWFMNPYYRANLNFSNKGVEFRDIRQYVEGSGELCREVACESINFATNATRVLDQVTNGDSMLVTEGKVTDVNIKRQEDKYVVSYQDRSGKIQSISFMPRDIAINDKISSIDSLILSAVQNSKNNLAKQVSVSNQGLQEGYSILEYVKFILFIILAIFIPGAILFSNPFLSMIGGIVQFTLVGYFARLLGFKELIWIYIIFCIGYFLVKKIYKRYSLPILSKSGVLIGILILAGSIFQVLPVFRSGTQTEYGLGFWGPNAHDGVWHLALINELSKNVPPNNPVLTGEVLKNYHYFYDLLVALTMHISGIPAVSLVFQMYPILFSLLLGIGGYLLSMKLFNSLKSALIGIYLVYFAGSFGWIVEYIHQGHIGGESAFWVNQPVSFNLNPPFAISLVILVGFLYLLVELLNKRSGKVIIGLIILGASLVSFKLYAFILLTATLLAFGMIRIITKKSTDVLLVFFGIAFLGLLILIPNYTLKDLFLTGGKTFIFEPFWFIHSMIDSPDRVGWTRLTLTRTVGLDQGNWIKFFGAEAIGLAIFILGNLGVRSVGLVSMFYAKSVNDLKFPIMILSAISFVLPLIIIQAGNPWNVIQFFYYGLFFSALWAGYVLALIAKFKIFGKIILVVLLLIAPINALVTANSYLYPIPNVVLCVGEQQALQFLSTQPSGSVLTYPYDSNLKKKYQGSLPLAVYETSSYVSAFSAQTTFIEDTIQQDILQTDYKQRLMDATFLFKTENINWAKEFLSSNNIKYIYVPTLYELNIDLPNTKVIYENDDAKIYETI